MTRAKTTTFSLSVAAGLLLAAMPALAQDQPPPVAPPPPSTSVPPPMQALAAPKSGDDMTGSLGFGVGVAGGTTALVRTLDSVALKYWLNDALAIVPLLAFNYTKPSGGGDAAWVFNPEAVVLYTPFRTTSTRFSLGGGIGFSVGKTPPAPNTAVSIYVPIQAGVEHFFTRWFSLGIAARTRLIDYEKDQFFASTINTTAFLGQLFFYTD
jgi:hypothetical protein